MVAAAPFLDRCRCCGVESLHRAESELSIPCQISNLHYALTHWQARVWSDLREDEHDESRAYMVKDLSELRALSAARAVL